MGNRKQPTPPPMNQRKPAPPPAPPRKWDSEAERLRAIIARAKTAADDSHLIQMEGAQYLGVRKQLRDVAAILGEA